LNAGTHNITASYSGTPAAPAPPASEPARTAPP
jgi:hypothetical protein